LYVFRPGQGLRKLFESDPGCSSPAIVVLAVEDGGVDASCGRDDVMTGTEAKPQKAIRWSCSLSEIAEHSFLLTMMSMAVASSSETSEPPSGLTEFRQHDFDNDDEYQVATHVRIHDDN
jgi:hypothetical protein